MVGIELIFAVYLGTEATVGYVVVDEQMED